MRHFAFCLTVVLVAGCGSGGEKEELGAADSPASSSSAMIRQRTNTDPFLGTPQEKLGDGEVRVSLLVLPGDAVVEVNKVPVRRRNGMIELVGAIGTGQRVDVFWGANATIEKMVTIAASGVSPPLIDAEAENKSKGGPAKTPAVFDVNE